jgi:tetratricopeptide (TPR) repeat protein
MMFRLPSPMVLVWISLVATTPGLAMAQTATPAATSSREQSGKQLFEAGRWTEAADEFAAAYGENNDPSMLFNMALCHRRAGNAKRSLALYQRFVAEAPNNSKRSVADTRIREIQQELAASPATAATGPGSTRDVASYEQEGKRLFEAGRWADAAAAFEAAHAAGKDPAMLFNIALCYRRAGNARRALTLYRQYLVEVPDSPRRATAEARVAELEHEIASGPGAPQPDATAIGGECQKDLDCKGTRICEQGRCVEERPRLGAGAVACDPPCAAGRVCSKAGACVTPAEAAADEAPSPVALALGPKSFALGLALGYAAGGSVSIDKSSISPDGGYVFDLYFDKIIVPAFSLGAYLTASSMSWHGWSDYSASFQSFGVAAKGRFSLNRVISLRPSATLGYNHMDSEVFHSITGFNAGLALDLGIAVSDNFAFVPRVGFFSQPSGGGNGYEVTFGPHFYTAIGIEVGK